jgi:uncharacterized protein (TIGR02391 family)
VVSVRLNFFSHGKEIKRALIEHKEFIDPFKYPNEWAWITYAFSKDGKENNPLFEDALNDLTKWALTDESISQDRHLAPLSLCCYLASENKGRKLITEKIINKLNQFFDKDIDKFSVLNDPTQIFCIIVGIKEELLEVQRNKLISICNKNLNTGSTLRRVFFNASLLELGENKNINLDSENIDSDPSNIISIIWFYERYRSNSDIDFGNLWKNYENIKEYITLSDSLNPDSGRPLSIQELTMLYEAISCETQKPDPNMLFDMYILHERIRNVTESLFKNGEYFNAVFEATKVLNDFIRDKTQSSESEINLVKASFGDPNSKEIKNPKIKFNPLDPQSTDYRSQQNEQRGLSSIACGIFYAFRHPKGHEPKDKNWGNIEPYEALDQLVVISYLMKRIEEATK